MSKFETGRDPISLIVAAVERQLRTAFEKDQWAFEIVPDPMTTNEFSRLIGITPCLLLAWHGFRDAGLSREFRATASLALTVILKNPDNRAARFIGDTHRPGLFPTLSTLIKALHGVTLQGIGSIRVTGSEQRYADAAADQSLVIGSVELEIGVGFDSLADLAEADDFEGLIYRPEGETDEESVR